MFIPDSEEASVLASDNQTLANTPDPRTIQLLTERENEILEAWIENRLQSSDFRETLISGGELRVLIGQGLASSEKCENK